MYGHTRGLYGVVLGTYGHPTYVDCKKGAFWRLIGKELAHLRSSGSFGGVWAVGHPMRS